MSTDRPRRVLLICPHLRRRGGADGQRVWQMLPYFEALGWQASVLAIDPEGDADNGLQVPGAVELREVKAISSRLTRWIGIRSPGLRARRRIDHAVRHWNPPQAFDIVFLSTTEFALWSLAPGWHRDLGLPYVLDWQDPWVTDYYRDRPQITPPGGRLKFSCIQWLARRAEPPTFARACAHVCVANAYADDLAMRYSVPRDERFAIIPFATPDVDVGEFAGVESTRRLWTYVGRVNDGMRFALECLFRALARTRKPFDAEAAVIRLVGTAYVDGAATCVGSISRRVGVEQLVRETPSRLPRNEVDRELRAAEALLLLGSDDPAYVASKLPHLLALPRPLLAIVHSRSDMCALLRGQPGVVVITFDDTGETARDRVVDLLCAQWMNCDLASLPLTPRRIDKISAASMTKSICELFDRVLAQQKCSC